jgi:hypothetical protein
MAWVIEVGTWLKSVDWTPFEARYPRRGRPPYAPRLMAGLIVFGARHGIDSSRRLESFARTNLACMWLTAGIVPDHSAICDFLKRHADLIQGHLFEELTRNVLRKCGGDGSDVSVDGSVMQAVASRLTKLSLEAATSAAKEAERAAEANPGDPVLADKAEQAKKLAEVAAKRTEARAKKGKDGSAVLVSPTDPDAVFQPTKEKLLRPSYKPSIAVNPQQIVLAHNVHPSSELAVLEPVMDQVERVAGEPVRRLKVDASYFADQAIALALERDVDILCPPGKVLPEGATRRRPPKYFQKREFRYDEVRDTYTCPAGKTLTPISRARNGECTVYATTACAGCPLRNRCARSARGRRLKRYPGDDRKDALAEVMRQPRAMAAFRRRSAEVEPVFARIKRLRNRFTRRGLAGVRLEFALHVIGYNLGRGIALLRGVAVRELSRHLREQLRVLARIVVRYPPAVTRPRLRIVIPIRGSSVRVAA